MIQYTVFHMIRYTVFHKMFADDIQLDAAGQSANEISLTLSLALPNLALYLLQKGLILNPGETEVQGIHSSRRAPLQLSVTSTIRGTPIAQADSAKYLGLQLDEKLRWDRQVSDLVRKTSSKLKPLRTIRPSLSEC